MSYEYKDPFDTGVKFNSLDPNDFNGYLERTEHTVKLRQTDEYIDEIVASFDDPNFHSGDKLPFGDHEEQEFAFRKGELTIWTGFNGHGKSMVLGQVMLDIIQNTQKKVCFASMEMAPHATIRRMAQQAMGSKPNKEQTISFATFIKDYCWIYNHSGTIKQKEMLDATAYAGYEKKIDHFVIDSLMKIDIDEDGYNDQRRFVDTLCSIAKDTGMHIHLVAHARKGNDEDKLPSKMDVRGGGSLTDQADNVLSVWQAKTESGRKANFGAEAILTCCKQRHGGWEGQIPLRFDKRSLRFIDMDLSTVALDNKERF